MIMEHVSLAWISPVLAHNGAMCYPQVSARVSEWDKKIKFRIPIKG